MTGERTARIESDVSHPEIVAAAIAPDNTDDVTTAVEGGRIVTTIERSLTSSLEATVDDYVVNLDVALRVAQHGTDTNTSDTP